jgi:hypothetical protein
MLAPKFSLGGGQPAGEDYSPPTDVGLVPKQGRLLAPHKRASNTLALSLRLAMSIRPSVRRIQFCAVERGDMFGPTERESFTGMK